MSDRANPQEPNGRTFFFGPTTSRNVTLSSENITDNGLLLFKEREKVERAAEERKRVFGSEFCVGVVRMKLIIAEHPDEWKALQGYNSYVVAGVDPNGYGLSLYGTTTVDEERVHSAHDSWSPFSANGAHPYTDFDFLVRSFGTLSEIVRQEQCRVYLIAIQIDWNPNQLLLFPA
jgi:hypothetical protein